jgi:hypothetical protein
MDALGWYIVATHIAPAVFLAIGFVWIAIKNP